jgi:uncharacterized protein
MKARGLIPWAVAFLVGLGLCVGLAAATPPTPAAPSRWVTDTVGFLPPPVLQALDERLQSYERTTGHQVIVWIGGTLGQDAIEEWAARTFAAWRVGRKGIDDGLALFVFAEDRKLAIEVGYGLEEKVTDALSSRIINELMVPKLRANDREGAFTAGIDALLAAIEGRPLKSDKPPEPPAPAFEPGLFGWIAIGVFVLLFGALFIRNPSLALSLLFFFFSRGGRRSGNGGGGFGGGGGRSGGGGARGAW